MKNLFLSISKILILVVFFLFLFSFETYAAPAIRIESTGTRVDKGENVRFVVTGITDQTATYRIELNSTTWVEFELEPCHMDFRGGFGSAGCSPASPPRTTFTVNLNTSNFNISGLSNNYTATLSGPGANSSANFTVFNLPKSDGDCDSFEVNMPSTVPKNESFPLQIITNCTAEGDDELRANFYLGEDEDFPETEHTFDLTFNSGVFNGTITLEQAGTWTLVINSTRASGDLADLFESVGESGTIEVTESDANICSTPDNLKPIGVSIACPDECPRTFPDAPTTDKYCFSEDDYSRQSRCFSPELVEDMLDSDDWACNDDGREIVDPVACGVVTGEGTSCESSDFELCHQDGEVKCEAIEAPEEEEEPIKCPVCPDGFPYYTKYNGMCCRLQGCRMPADAETSEFITEPDPDAENATCQPGQICHEGRGCKFTPDDPQKPPCADETCSSVQAGDTALGLSFPTDPAGFIRVLLGILLSVSGMVAVALIIRSGYQYMTSRGNPDTIQEARDRLTSAIVGLLFIIFSLVILQVIGVDILRIPGFTN